MPHAAKHETTTPRPLLRRERGQPAIADRVLAEALRIVEEGRSIPIDDRAAVSAVLSECSGCDFEERLLERARRLPEATQLRESIHWATSALRWALALASILALVSGGLAARAALHENTASVLVLVFGLLGIQTLMLMVWAGMLLGGGRLGRGGMLGSAVVGLGRFLAQAMAPAESRCANFAAVQALSLVHAGGRAGRRALSAISHGLWALFNAGALLVLAALFLGEGYQFRWDSTWLSQESYGSLISALAAGPEALGFDVPDRTQIASSRMASGAGAPGAQDAAAREAWSWFFFGSVFVYGLLPRMILLTASLALRRKALGRHHLDLERPGFAVLRPRVIGFA